MVDETTTEQNVKQFNMHMHDGTVEDKIVRRYLSSSFLGHTRADDLKISTVDALSVDGLPLVKCCI